MLDFERGHFIPHNFEGNQQINNQKTDLHIYAPSDFKERDLKEQVVVAKPNGHPEQLFIGPINDVFAIAKGFNILDSLGYTDLRKLSVIVKINPSETDEKKDYDLGLLDQYGILQKISESSHRKDLNNYGIFTDIRNPVFISYGNFIQTEGTSLLGSAVFASDAIHEWTHHLQKREGLPSNSLWAERAAMTKQAVFLLEFLNTNKLTKTEEARLLIWLKHLARRTYDYRNGQGFEDHLVFEGSKSHGTPLKGQNLHSEDFIFGY